MKQIISVVYIQIPICFGSTLIIFREVVHEMENY